MWGMIATWRMAVEGITKGAEMLKETAGTQEMPSSLLSGKWRIFLTINLWATAGFQMRRWRWRWMHRLCDGNTLDIGAVAAIRLLHNPVSIARRLSREKGQQHAEAEGAGKIRPQGGLSAKIC